MPEPKHCPSLLYSTVLNSRSVLPTFLIIAFQKRAGPLAVLVRAPAPRRVTDVRRGGRSLPGGGIRPRAPGLLQPRLLHALRPSLPRAFPARAAARHPLRGPGLLSTRDLRAPLPLP